MIQTLFQLPDTNHKLSKSCNNDEKLTSVYQSAIGSLLYTAKEMHSDIALVGFLCEYCQGV